MNRKQRRAAKVAHVVEMTAKQVAAMPTKCAWRGCLKSTHAGSEPPGWRLLFVMRPDQFFSSKRVGPERHLVISYEDMAAWDRDAVLCPEHAAALDGLLEDLMRWTGKPAGTA